MGGGYDETVQREHVNHERWLSIVNDLLEQNEMELNNISTTVQCVTSFTQIDTGRFKEM